PHAKMYEFNRHLPRAGLWLTTVERVYPQGETGSWSTAHEFVGRSLASFERLTPAERGLGERLRAGLRKLAGEAAKRRQAKGQPTDPQHVQMLTDLGSDPFGLLEPSSAPSWLTGLDYRTLLPSLVPEFFRRLSMTNPKSPTAKELSVEELRKAVDP